MKRIITLLVLLAVFLTTLTGCGAKTPDLSSDELKETFMNVYKNGEEWVQFYGSLYIEDWNDYFSDDNGEYLGLSSDIKSKDELKEYLSTMYTQDVVDACINSSTLVEKDGKLYTGLYGIGGIGGVVFEVSATKNDEGYLLTVKRCELNYDTYEPDYDNYNTVEYQLVYQNDTWLFTTGLKLSFDRVDENCEFIVE